MRILFQPLPHAGHFTTGSSPGGSLGSLPGRWLAARRLLEHLASVGGVASLGKTDAEEGLATFVLYSLFSFRY